MDTTPRIGATEEEYRAYMRAQYTTLMEAHKKLSEEVKWREFNAGIHAQEYNNLILEMAALRAYQNELKIASETQVWRLGEEIERLKTASKGDLMALGNAGAHIARYDAGIDMQNEYIETLKAEAKASQAELKKQDDKIAQLEKVIAAQEESLKKNSQRQSPCDR